MELVFKIAAGVLLAFLIVFLGNRIYINYQLKELSLEINRQTEIRNAKLRAKEKADFDNAVEARKKLIANADEKRRKEILLAEKQRAWNDYYNEPPECLIYDISADQMIICANNRIKARRAFDATW